MRDYGKVAPQFWTGTTGKALKQRGSDAVIVALYLMTSPHANMIGVYHCPVGYIVIDTGLTLEGASKGLGSAIEVGFCTFDAASDYVFVHEFAAYQIGEALEANDNRCKGIRNEMAKLPAGLCRRGFFEKYRLTFHLPDAVCPEATPEAPSKPLRSQKQKQEQKQEQEQKKKQEQKVGAADAASPRRGQRLPDKWKLPKAWGDWALATYPLWTADKVRLEGERFGNHWRAKSGKDATKLDWRMTWENWCHSELAHRDDPKLPRGTATDANLAAANAASDEEAKRLLFGAAPEVIDACN